MTAFREIPSDPKSTIVILNKSNTPNQTINFDFQDNVLDYVVGITYWKFSFGNADHKVEKISLSVATNQPQSRRVSATLTGELRDSDDKTIEASSSIVNLSCIAIVGSPNNNFALANANGIANGSQSGGISLPSSSLKLQSSFLSGFLLDFGGGNDHEIKKIEMAAGLHRDGNVGHITSKAEMNDDSGHTSSSNSIDGGLIAIDSNGTGLLTKTLTNKQESSAITRSFNTPLSGATALIQSCTVTFGSGDDEKVKSVGAGSSEIEVTDNGTVILKNGAKAFIEDESGNTQDDKNSHVTMILVAAPKSLG